MSRRFAGRTPRPCPTYIYRKGDRIKGNTVVYVDMRPGQEHIYHKMIQETLDSANGNKWTDLFINTGVGRQDLRKMLLRGVDDGWFKDTDKIGRWLSWANNSGAFSARGAKPLELLIVHAESHISDLCHQIMVEHSRPAGIIFSGSPKMLDQVKDTSVIQDSIRLMQFCHEIGIPGFNICFGCQMMAHALFGVMPEYLIAPEQASLLVESTGATSRRFFPVSPGERLMIYGRQRLQVVRTKRSHPVLRMTHNTFALEVHSMYLDPDHPSLRSSVLAVSHRRFARVGRTKRKHEIHQYMVEVLSAGPWWIGTQLHPELTPMLLYVLTFHRGQEAQLRAEGHDIQYIRDQLYEQISRHDQYRYYTGERVGYNFIMHILCVNYIYRLMLREFISPAEARKALGCLKVDRNDVRARPVFKVA